MKLLLRKLVCLDNELNFHNGFMKGKDKTIPVQTIRVVGD